jgi:integrase
MPLTVSQARAAVAASKAGDPQKIADGRSLSLLCRGGRGYWVFNFRDPNTGKLRSAGLGSLEDVSPQQARIKADAMRSGALPPPHGVGRHYTVATTGETFADAARQYLADHANEWAPVERVRRVRLMAEPVAAIADKAVTEITPKMVADVLRPVWKGPGAKPGSLIRSLIERIIGAEIARKNLTIANPALWSTQRHFLSNATVEVEHHAALPYAELPAFLVETADPLLRFIILTASRRGEVIGDATGKSPMQWSEVDLEARTWTVPAERMKDGKPHVVPLSEAAIATLGEPKQMGQVFAGAAKANAHRLQKLVEARDVTVHGFRSTFRDWAAEQSDMPSDIAELCLAHTVGNRVERAYRRTDMLARRRELMDQWAAFATCS